VHLEIHGDNHFLLLTFYVKKHKNKQGNSSDSIWSLKILPNLYVFGSGMTPNLRVMCLKSC
jgi:hypothetical protein